MIHGHRPNGEWETKDKKGFTIARETRQCVHCQFMWTYQPGSGTLRGYCLKHNGWICARAECMAEQERILNHYEQVTKSRPSCLAFEEYQDFLLETLAQAGDQWQLNSSGLLVPKS
jgi:hypothetical protein